MKKKLWYALVIFLGLFAIALFATEPQTVNTSNTYQEQTESKPSPVKPKPIPAPIPEPRPVDENTTKPTPKPAENTTVTPAANSGETLEFQAFEGK